MSHTKQLLIVIATAVVATVAAATFYYFWNIKHTAYTDIAEVRQVVAGLGDELRGVSLLAPDVAASMDQHYAFYVHPELLAKWKANPMSALGRLTSSPWPDRIDITDTVKNEDGSYTITGNVVEKANGVGPSSTNQVVKTTPYRFTLKQGGDGWQITDVEKVGS